MNLIKEKFLGKKLVIQEKVKTLKLFSNELPTGVLVQKFRQRKTPIKKSEQKKTNFPGQYTTNSITII